MNVAFKCLNELFFLFFSYVYLYNFLHFPECLITTHMRQCGLNVKQFTFTLLYIWAIFDRSR